MQLFEFSVNSVTQSCPALCNPMDCSSPGFPVHHQLPELTQTHVHRVGDAIPPSHPLSSSSPALNLSQCESFPMGQFFTSGGQSIGVLASASVLPMNIQDWFLLGWTGWILVPLKCECLTGFRYVFIKDRWVTFCLENLRSFQPGTIVNGTWILG